MPISKAKKKEIWEKVADIAKTAKTMVLVGFNRLTVAESQSLRRILRSDGVSYLAVKKSVTKRALSEARLPGTIPELPGQLALAYGADEVAPARGIFEAGKKLEKKLSILGGIFGGEFVAAAKMMEVAAIPPEKVLYGMFVNVINSPIQGLAIVLSKVAEKKS